MQEISKKIVLVGHFGVGKTSLIRRFVHSKFSEDYISTIGVKVDKKVLQIGETQLTFLIWDVAGESSLEKVPPAYLAGSHGFLYVFDLTRPSTYMQLDSEIALLKERFANTPIQVIGNKKDMLSPETLQALGGKGNPPYDILSSALTGEGVEEAFLALGIQMLGT